MTRRRWTLVLVLLAATIAVNWRLQGQTVDLVFVNASGRGAQVSFQPALFKDQTSTSLGPCESKSLELYAGQTWRLTSDHLVIDSTSVPVPILARKVAFEVWLNADGSNRVVSPYPIEQTVNAPYPRGCITFP